MKGLMSCDKSETVYYLTTNGWTSGHPHPDDLTLVEEWVLTINQTSPFGTEDRQWQQVKRFKTWSNQEVERLYLIYPKPERPKIDEAQLLAALKNA
jgi:hypothetical protein